MGYITVNISFVVTNLLQKLATTIYKIGSKWILIDGQYNSQIQSHRVMFRHIVDMLLCRKSIINYSNQ
jgi:hypothetical protein